MLELKYAGKTDVGRKREHNEDTFYVGLPWEGNPHVFALVCDGMGGESFGDVASDEGLKTIVEYVKEHGDIEDYQELMLQAFLSGHNRLKEIQHERKVSNIFTVVTGVLVDPVTGKAYYGHVGDTRLYMLANGDLKQITKDQSEVGELEWHGYITEEEAMNHGMRPLVDRALGFKELDERGCIECENEQYFATGILELPERFSLLVASDGLFDLVFRKDSQAILERNASLEERVQGLIDAANNAGGKDNVTVVVVENA